MSTKKSDKKIPLVRTGKRLIIPTGMDLSDAISQLQDVRYEEQKKVAEAQQEARKDEVVVNIRHVLDAYPLEGAWALSEVLKKRSGSVKLLPEELFEAPPMLIGLDLGNGEVTQVPWGRMHLKDVGILETGFQPMADSTFKFVLKGSAMKKHEKEIADIVKGIKHHLKANSLYRGKAVRVNFPDEDKFSTDVLYMPKVMDLSGVREEELIFPREIEELISTSIFTPIRFSKQCRAAQIPLKRGILLEGPYGVGKTLTANVVAKIAAENDWTFIYVSKATDLAKAYAMAKLYQPCVVFAEDVDKAAEGYDRTEKINEVLNTLDGVDSKDVEIMVILTTNRVDVINSAMLRPGRLDAVIPLRAPDAEAAERLIKLYGRDLLPAKEDLTEASAELAGQNPAMVREAIERAKLHAIGDGRVGKVSAGDLLKAARSLRMQVKLLEKVEVRELSNEERAAALFGDKIAAVLTALAAGRPTNHRPTLEASTTSDSKELPDS